MMDAAIIAAGEGSRLRSGGIATPKPLVHLGGKPILARIVDAMAGAGIGKVRCIVNSPAIASEIRRLDLRLPIELTVLATPSSLHSLLVLAPGFRQPFLLTTVDSIFHPDELAAFVERGRSSAAGALLAVTDFIDDENPLHVSVDAEWRITSFARPENPKWVTGGLYIIRPEMFAEEDEVTRLGISRLRNFLAFLLKRGHRLDAFPFTKIVDVDRPEDIRAAEEMLAGPAGSAGSAGSVGSAGLD